MKMLVKKSISLVLVVVMLGLMIISDAVVIGAETPVYAEELTQINQEQEIDSLGAVDPAKVANTTQQLLKVLKKFLKPEDLTTITGVLSRATQIGSLISGGISILQMCGILEDPTRAALRETLAVLNQQNIALENLKGQLDEISNTLINMKANAELTKRAKEVFDYTNNWIAFQRTYLEAMKAYMDEYETWTLVETRNWACNSTYQTDLYAYYTNIQDAETQQYKKTQTYSKTAKSDLAKADNGEVIETSYTVGLPSAYVIEALKNYNENTWDQDKYREQIAPLLAAQIKQAMTDNKLECSQSFKNSWNAADATGKSTIATNVANDLINSAIYNASLRGVASHSDEVSKIISKMEATWINLKTNYTGLSALLVPLQKTYCFEGEAKEKINQVIDAMNAQISMFAVFTMTLASQSPFVLKPRKEKIINDWIEGGEYFDKVRKASITGHDNFCYINNSLVEYKEIRLYGESSITYTEKERAILSNQLRIDGHDAQPWKITDQTGKTLDNLSIVGSDEAIVLYKTYLANNSKKEKKDQVSFSQYLYQNNTGIYQTFSSSFMTKFGGVQTFNLDQTISMNCYDVGAYYTKPDKFNSGTSYDIMWERKRWDYTCLHERVYGETLSADGVFSTNKTLVARAQYCEAHGRWDVDEPWYFSSENSYTFTTRPQKGASYGRCKFETIADQYILMCSNYTPSEQIEFKEDEFNPAEITDKCAIITNVDTSPQVNEDAKIINLNDWKNIGISFVSSPDTDIELKQDYSEYIDNFINSEAAKGRKVTLSEDDKDNLEDTIVKLVRGAENELASNLNMQGSYYDPFCIYGNDAATEKLAKKVLPSTEITSDGDTVQPVQNMITAAFYEPYVYLKLEKSGYKYKIKPVLGYIVSPSLLVWNDDTKCVSRYSISDSVMEELGLTMRIRMSAAFAGSNNALSLIHFDNVDNMNKLETLTGRIQGFGSNRYADVTVSRCSLFVPSYFIAPDTGDTKNYVPYAMLMMLALVGLSVALTRLNTKQRKNGQQ